MTNTRRLPFFDIWSKFYDLPIAQRLAYRPVQDAVVAELLAAHRADGRLHDILDVGCGTGILAERLPDVPRRNGHRL